MRTSRVAYRLVIFVVLLAACVGVAQAATVYYQFTFPARPDPNPVLPQISFTIAQADFLLAADGWVDLNPPVVAYGQTFSRWAYTTGIWGIGAYCFAPADGTPDVPGIPNWMQAQRAEITSFPAGDPPYSFDLDGVRGTTIQIPTATGITHYSTPGGVILMNDGPPPLVEMAAMWTDARGGAITIGWETASEVGTAGFRILRSQDGGTFAVVTQELIPAAGGPASPARYSWTDEDVIAGQTYKYMIEEVEDSGKTNSFGPLSAAVTSSRSPRRR